MKLLSKAKLIWGFPFVDNVMDVPEITICLHRFSPPDMSQTVCEEAASCALNVPSYHVFSDSVILRSLWTGYVVRVSKIN